MRSCRLRRRDAQLAGDDLECLAIAVGAVAADAADHEVGYHRRAPPLFARVHVGEVHLDGRTVGDLERVPNRVAVVRPRTRVYEQRVRELGRLVQPLDVLSLGVRLEEARLESELARPV